MTKTTKDIENFQYDHIFNLILGIFKFSEKKYGNFVKDVIRILLEFEKNGETIIDVDNSLIIFELLEDGWPNKHIDVLKNIGLIGSLHSPFVLVNRKLSLSKWSKKIERVIYSFLKKIDTDNLMNSIIKLSDNAASRIKEIMSNAEKDSIGVRVSVKSGGCAGMSYVMEYTKELNPNDEVIEDKGVKVFVDSAAIMYLLGTEMDYKKEELSSSFVFNNPNETERCGCGESFKIS